MYRRPCVGQVCQASTKLPPLANKQSITAAEKTHGVVVVVVVVVAVVVVMVVVVVAAVGQRRRRHSIGPHTVR